MTKWKEHFRWVSSGTPQYFCNKCKHPHSQLSKKGKEHFIYANR